MEKSIDCFYLAKENLKRKAHRSISLVALVSLLSFTVFSSLLIIQSLKNGIDGVQNRLGADLIVVPEEYESEAFFFQVSRTIFTLINRLKKNLKASKELKAFPASFILRAFLKAAVLFPFSSLALMKNQILS